MPVSAILWWLVVLLLVLMFLVLAVWPRFNHLARLLALAACVCGVLMLVLTSELMWWLFVACAVASAAVGALSVHRRQRRWAREGYTPPEREPAILGTSLGSILSGR